MGTTMDLTDASNLLEQRCGLDAEPILTDLFAGNAFEVTDHANGDRLHLVASGEGIKVTVLGRPQ